MLISGFADDLAVQGQQLVAPSPVDDDGDAIAFF
jgi:hypothetical protein